MANRLVAMRPTLIVAVSKEFISGCKACFECIVGILANASNTTNPATFVTDESYSKKAQPAIIVRAIGRQPSRNPQSRWVHSVPRIVTAVPIGAIVILALLVN